MGSLIWSWSDNVEEAPDHRQCSDPRPTSSSLTNTMSTDERDSLPSSNANVDSSRSRLSVIFKKAVGRTNLKSSNVKFAQSLPVGRVSAGNSDSDGSVNSFDLEKCVNIIESIN